MEFGREEYGSEPEQHKGRLWKDSFYEILKEIEAKGFALTFLSVRQEGAEPPRVSLRIEKLGASIWDVPFLKGWLTFELRRYFKELSSWAIFMTIADEPFSRAEIELDGALNELDYSACPSGKLPQPS